VEITENFLKSLKHRIKQSEGFGATPYQDTEGVWTFGYGFTAIARDEADLVLQIKLRKKIKSDLLLYPQEKIHLNEIRLMIFIEMIYQLGVAGIKGFKNFRQAIIAEDWEKAADEMLDSKWHRQTPGRCERLAEEFRKG